MPDPEVRLMKAVVLQAIKDYADKFSTSKYSKKNMADKIREWVIKKEGTFDLCTVAMGVDEEVLQEMMLKAMNKIDQKRKPLSKYILEIDYKDIKKESFI